MIGPHAYASTSLSRGRVLSCIALAALLVSILSIIAVDNLTRSLSSSQYKAYLWVVGPLTITGAFGVVYLFYDRWLWKIFSHIPDLSGVWIGVWHPNYQENRPHLGIVYVGQTWSEIYMQVDFFYKGTDDDEWSTKRRLGSDKSITAGMTEVSASKATISITYLHFGAEEWQPDFQGTMFLEYQSNERKLTGKYFTNRKDHKTGIKGSLGSVAMKRIAKEPLSFEEILIKYRQDIEEFEKDIFP